MKKVVFTFGRMNPPTTGHQLLVNKLVAYARQIGAAPRVYLSHSVGAKDPLQYDKKVSFARAAFGSLVKKSNARTVIEVLKQLDKEGYTHVTMFAGSDRVPEFSKLLLKYNGDLYNFEHIEVKSAGERDPDADDVSGMSASKMRALAKDDKVAEFLRGAPNTLKAAQAKNMFNAVRRALLGEDVMDHNLDDKFISFVVEAAEDDNIVIPSDSEIAKQIDDMDPNEFDLDDADALMLDVILGQDVDEKEEMNEAKVLSIQTRQKLAQRMKGMSKRLARLRDIKRKQMPASQRLRMRARKAALLILRRRATGKKSLDYNSLSRSQRIAVDNALVNRFGKGLNRAVDTISKRILPMIRKKAQTNVAKARDIKEQTIDPKTNKQVPDQAKDNPLNLDPLKLTINTIDPTKDDRSAPDPQTAHLHKNRKLRYKNIFNTEARKSAIDKDARDPGDTNIIYQMRKVVNSRGEHETVFADKHKAHISVADAKKLLAKFDALRLPADKHEFTIQAGQSLAKFRDVLAHGVKHEKKGISLAGKKFNEFYLGVGRTRTTGPFDHDEPPGTRRIAEVAKDEDRPEDPNRSRPLSQKMDLLMRLGLVDQEELQKFRRALRSSKKFALQSPQLREKLAELLDKLIDLTTKDPATYSRVRYNVVTKEALSLMNKAEKSGVDVDIIFEVFSRGYNKNEDINEAFARVNSFIAGGKAADMDKDLSEKVKAPTGGLKGACWKNYTAVGFKMKNGRRVPNCVPKEETQIDEISGKTLQSYTAKRSANPSQRGTHSPEKFTNLARAKVAAGKSDDDSRHALNRYKMSGGKVKVAATEETDVNENNLYHVSWGPGVEHQVVAKHGAEAVSKAKAEIIKRTPKLKDKKYAGTFHNNPRVSNLSHERKAQKKVDEVLDTTVSRMNYLQKAGKQMYGKGSADAKSQTFKKRLAGAKLFNKMTDRKPKVPYDVKKEKVEEGYIVKYHDDKGKYKNSSRVFKDKNKADAHAARGNKITQVGGKYTVHQISDTGHEVKEGWVSIGGAKPRTFVTDKSKYAKKKKGVELRDPDPKPSPADKKARFNEGQADWAKARRDKDRSTVAYLNLRKKSYVDRSVTPFKADDAKIAADSMKAFLAKGGSITKAPPGKKTVKSMIKPKKYMTPNQASKVTENETPLSSTPVRGIDSSKSTKKVFEQNMTTHDAIPLHKRVKRVKSFHAWHPKSMQEVQRRADIKLVKAKLPDGRIVYRKERATSAVQQEMYTGSEPVSGNRADPANRFVGTNAIRQNYASVTPGQGSVAGEIAVAKFAPEKVDYTSSMAKKTHTEVDQSKDNLGKKHLSDIRKALGGIRESVELNESFAAGFELAPFARDYGIQVQSSFEHHPEVQEALDAQEDAMNEAIYQGREVPLNKPMKGDVKKSKVYVRDPSTGNVKKVNFGDKKLSIKKDQPARKRSYCARSSGQGNLTKKTSANYWSRRAWDC